MPLRVGQEVQALLRRELTVNERSHGRHRTDTEAGLGKGGDASPIALSLAA